MSTFEELVEELLIEEGGRVDDPEDSGGLTKYGISQKAYPDLDIEALTEDDARRIYKKDYWDRMRLDDMPAHLRRQLFFAGVNMGVRNPLNRAIQKIVGATADGMIGKETVAKVKAFEGADNIREKDIVEEAVDYYVGLARSEPSQRKYLNGWINRVVDPKGRPFGKGLIDLRSMNLDEVARLGKERIVVEEPQPKAPEPVEQEAPQESFEGNATPSQHHRPAPARESSVSLPDGFPEPFMAMLEEVVKASQSRSQEVSEPSTEPDVLKGREAAPFNPELDAFIQGVAEVNVQDEPELSPELDAFIDRAVRAMGTEETEAPVYAEEPQGGRDDSKDPIYGLF